MLAHALDSDVLDRSEHTLSLDRQRGRGGTPSRGDGYRDPSGRAAPAMTILYVNMPIEGRDSMGVSRNAQ